MSQPEYDAVRLTDILREESIEIHFQPIVSIHEKAVRGFEGLSRGVEMPTGRLIPPVVLIRKAAEEGLSLELDLLFRKKVFQAFNEQFGREPGLLLTVNLETNIEGDGAETALDPDAFLKLAHKSGLDPARVAIELVESRATNTRLLERFIDAQKEHGFLIALDDVGSGHSNLDRVAKLKPDLIKIDRSLILDLDKEYHKQEVFRSLVGLSRQTGAVVIAEGVETLDEAMGSLELGADMLQGYFFARPQHMEGGLYDRNEDLIHEVASRFRSRVIDRLNGKRERLKRCEVRLTTLKRELGKAKPKELDPRLDALIAEHPEVEALYVLDEAGVQVTRMACANRSVPERVRIFCKPWERGADHSLREYYLRLAQGDSRDGVHVTEPYISLAVGHLCVTLSSFFKDAYGRQYILCADMKPGEV